MSLWGNLDAANNAPKQGDTTGYGGSTPQVTANTQVYYGNTRTDAFITNAQIGVFGIDAAEKAITTGEAGSAQHAGWNIRKAGMGPVISISANNGAVAVNSFITFSGGSKVTGSGNTAANARISVNTAGYITGITVNSGGLYANTPVATANSGNSALTITMGGRANRVQYETIVAMGSMFGDGTTADDPIIPDS